MKRIFVPLTKVDEVKREVWGVAAVEQVDKVREILDYASSKPFFEQWSGEISKASDGKSLGNVRAMHDKVAAGKLTHFNPNDDLKQFEICAKIIDDNEWQKVAEGVYTGFSIGGAYERRWDDPALKGVKRYTANPSEVSLVDNPCIPGATFEAIKSDGTTELRKFIPAPSISDEDVERLAKAFAVEAAKSQNKTLRAHGASLLQKLDKISLPGLRKGLYDLQALSGILMDLQCVLRSLECEADWDNTESPIPDQLKDAVRTLSQILVDLAMEETAELTADAAKAAHAQLTKEVEKTTMKLTQLEKVVAESTDLDALRKAVTTRLNEIGKHVDGMRTAHLTIAGHLDALDGKKDEPGDPAKKAVADSDLRKDIETDLRKEFDARLKTIEDANAAAQKEASEQISNLAKAFGAFLAQPAASHVAVNDKGVAVTKEEDAAGVKKAEEPKDAVSAFKKIHQDGPVGRTA